MTMDWLATRLATWRNGILAFCEFAEPEFAAFAESEFAARIPIDILWLILEEWFAHQLKRMAMSELESHAMGYYAYSRAGFACKPSIDEIDAWDNERSSDRTEFLIQGPKFSPGYP